jgi:hypothetical protein
MNRLLLLPLALPFACLALLSAMALLSVVALAGALRVIGAVTSALGLSGRSDEDPWHGRPVTLTRSITLRHGTSLNKPARA